MTLRSRKRLQRKRGSALAATMIFVLVFSVAIASVASYTSQQTRNTYHTRSSVQSLEAAHATLQALTNNVMHIVQTIPPTQTQGQIGNLGNVIMQVQPKAFQGSRWVKEGNTRLTSVVARGPNDFQFREVTDPTDKYYGYSTARLDFELLSFMQEDSNRADLVGVRGAGVRTRVTIDYVPLYQFAIFYNGDLELHPGPVMEIMGRVHTNSNLLVASGNRLDFLERVSAAGQILRFANENQSGRVRFSNGARPTPELVDMQRNGQWLQNTSENWLDGSIERWNNMVRDRDHGVNQIVPPLPTGAQTRDLIGRIRATDSPELRDARFESLADVIVSGDPGNPATIRAYSYTRDADGNITGRTLFPNVGQFVKVGRFYDGQTMTIVRTLDIMMDQLLLHPAGTALAQGNGVLYVSTTPGVLDTYNLSPSNLDPIWQRDAAGRIQFSAQGIPLTVPVTQGGREGWRAAAQKTVLGGTVTFQNEKFKPAVRITNAAKNATNPQRLAGPVVFPANASNAFAFYTDRPLYVVGENVNTANRRTLVLGGDAITITSFEQVLAVRDTGTWTGSGNTWTFGATTNGILDSMEDGTLIRNGHTRDMGNTWTTSPNNNPAWNNQAQYNWEQSNGTDRRSEAVRAARSTINGILIMGNAPTVGDPSVPRGASHQSGGAHNVIRYNEDWENTIHTVNGSIICLFDSDVSVLHNRAGFRSFLNRSFNARETYYRPPNRDYRWDSSLQRATPPPGMPVVIDVTRFPIEVISRDYAVSTIVTP